MAVSPPLHPWGPSSLSPFAAKLSEREIPPRLCFCSTRGLLHAALLCSSSPRKLCCPRVPGASCCQVHVGVGGMETEAVPGLAFREHCSPAPAEPLPWPWDPLSPVLLPPCPLTISVFLHSHASCPMTRCGPRCASPRSTSPAPLHRASWPSCPSLQPQLNIEPLPWLCLEPRGAESMRFLPLAQDPNLGIIPLLFLNEIFQPHEGTGNDGMNPCVPTSWLRNEPLSIYLKPLECPSSSHLPFPKEAATILNLLFIIPTNSLNVRYMCMCLT